MKTAACYIRVSTDYQTEYSPDSQLKAIQQYCERNEILLLEDCIFAEDGGKSGKDTKKRTEFQRLIALSKKKPKPFDAIMVWKFSRFARNQEESIVIKSMLQKQGIEVISISEPIPDNAFGSLIERIIEWSDEYYLTNLSEEVKRGMKERASRGEPVTPPPIGYKLESGMWVPDEQADYVRKIFNDYLSGLGLRTIAQKYAALGLRTKRGNTPDNRFIEYMLRNPAYIGKIRWSKNGRAASTRHYDDPNILVYDGKHKPLIDVDTFEAVQNKLNAKKQMYLKYQRSEQKANYMLRGLVRCSACGATLTMNTRHIGLQCHNYNRGSCTVSHYVTEKYLNNAVIEYLKNILDNPFLISVTTKHSSLPEQQTLDLQKMLDNENKKLQRVKIAYENGIDTLEEYKVNKTKILNAIQQIKNDMSASKKEELNIEEFNNRIVDVLEIITNDNQSAETKNKALRLIIEKIIYNKANKNIDIIFYS